MRSRIWRVANAKYKLSLLAIYISYSVSYENVVLHQDNDIFLNSSHLSLALSLCRGSATETGSRYSEMCLQVLLCCHQRKASKCQSQILDRAINVSDCKDVHGLKGTLSGDFAACFGQSSAEIITEYLLSTKFFIGFSRSMFTSNLSLIHQRIPRKVCCPQSWMKRESM